MSGNVNRQQGRGQIADLRAGLKAIQSPPLPLERNPPKPRKAKKVEQDEERWAKAERQAQLQHTTSLLDGGKKSKKPYVRVGQRAEKKSGGLFFQLLLVMIIAGGVAYALDPTIVPKEWNDKAWEAIKGFMPA